VTFVDVDASLCGQCIQLNPAYSVKYSNLQLDGEYSIFRVYEDDTCLYANTTTGTVDISEYLNGDCSGTPDSTTQFSITVELTWRGGGAITWDVVAYDNYLGYSIFYADAGLSLFEGCCPDAETVDNEADCVTCPTGTCVADGGSIIVSEA